MKNKKIIVTDLDGTLLNSNREVTDNTVEYLKKLKDLGHIIVIATGRILDSAIDVTKGALFANYVISDNGAVIYNMDTKTITFKNNINKEQARKICDYYFKYEEHIKYMDICDLNYYNKYTSKEYQEHSFSKKIEDVNMFLDKSDCITHISIMSYSNDIIIQFSEELKEEITDLNFTIMRDSFSDVKWIDISNNNVSKYTAIKIVSDIENVSNENVIAFGDGLNDIDMIKNCGVGIAMGNALEEVKLVASGSTDSNDFEGVINYLINNL